MMVFIDYAPIDQCQSLEDTFGEICIQCNLCGRFDKAAQQEPEGVIRPLAFDNRDRAMWQREEAKQ